MIKETLKSRLHELEQAISRNRLEHEKLVKEYTLLKNSLSPLTLLSDDILYLVFDLCAQFDTYPLTNRSATLWAVSQTCQRWRNVALANPSLWRWFCIDNMEENFPKDPISMVKTWLERSQSVPLRCEVYVGESSDEPEDREIEETILKLLMNECHRLIELDLNVDARVDLYYSFATKRTSFPLLRNLEVSVCPPDEPRDSVSPPDFCDPLEAPGLTNASINTYTHTGSLIRAIPTIPLPWHQLTRYTCVYYPDREFFDIAAKLCNLQSLELDVEHDSPLSQDIPHVTLPGLRSVRLKRGELYTAIAFMDHVTFPVLESLEVKLHYQAIDSDEAADSLLQAVSSLQHRSSCQLQELTVRPGAITSPNSPRLSLSTVRILHLSIDDEEDLDPVQLRALDALQSTSLFPGLTTLHIEADRWSSSRPVWHRNDLIPALVKTIEARRTKASINTTQLASMRFDWRVYSERSLGLKPVRIPHDLPAYQRLLELRRDGFRLSGSAFSHASDDNLGN
ncbi:hypothetical protein AAF712_014874 [Marasmius tenuissimus]|uniref:F-box domain-containing protein n=1 Tax=Marasmius tenuissimus TaxID=585030 RepID=A0ABR2ZB48_9AGAR